MIKRALLLVLLLLLLGPGLQAKFHWFDDGGLAGAYQISPHPTFSLDEVLAGRYQPQLERYLEDRLGFRPWLIRLRNQISFSLLGVVRSSDLVVGRDEVLFQPGVVSSYVGEDFLGDDEIRYRVRRMRAVERALAQRGIPFLFVMAPNKARFMPEALPLWTKKPQPNHSNYEGFMREMKASGLPVLDLVRVFSQWKDTCRYPLFPKGGTHWSGYGVVRAADTLFRRIEQVGHVDLIDFSQRGPLTVTKDSLRVTDSDLSGPLNLLFPYHPYAMAYARVVFEPQKPGQPRPNLLISGDSFNWGFMQFAPYLQTLFAPESRFWGVDGTIFSYAPDYARTGEQLAQLDLRQQIESRQFVLMLITEHNLVYDSFINHLYDLYYPLTEADNRRIKQLEQKILQQPGASDSLWAQSARRNTSSDQLLHEQALHLYNHTER